MTVIDCVTTPPVDAMRAAGVTGVIRYLSWADLRDTLHKVIHQAEFQQLHGAGFDILLNWEYAATDWLGGASAGASHAVEAVRQAQALGYPQGCAIVGSADLNMTAAQWASVGSGYAQAFAAGVRGGGYWPGVYGPWDVLTWCAALGKFAVFWQAGMSTSWSAGRNAQPWPSAEIRQVRNGRIAGLDVDFNETEPDYGQYKGADMPFLDDPDAAAVAWRVDALTKGLDTVAGGPTKGEPVGAWTKVAAPATVDTHALATDIVQQLEATGVVTASGIHDIVKQVLDAKLAAAAAA